MKFELNKKYLSISIYAFGVAAAAILFYFCASALLKSSWDGVSVIFDIIRPIFYGLVIAYIINPLVKILENLLKNFLISKIACKLKIKKINNKIIRALGIAFSWFIIIFVISFIVSTLIPCIEANISKIKSNSNLYFTHIDKWVSEFEKMIKIPNGLITKNINNLVKNFNLESSLQQMLPHIVSITKQVTVSIINMFVAVIVSIYFIFSKELFCAQIKKIISAFIKAETIEKIFDIGKEVNAVFNKFLFGKIIDSLILGIICYIGMLIFKMPYAVLISLIVGVTNIIPYFGPLIGAIPCCIILLLESPVKSVVFAIFIFALQQFDGNILGPKILGETIGLNGFWVIFSIVFFGGFFGVIGMFFGVPFFAAFYVFFKRIIERRLAAKNLPIETKEYAKPKAKV